VLEVLDKRWEGKGVGELCVDSRLCLAGLDRRCEGEGVGELCVDSRLC